MFIDLGDRLIKLGVTFNRMHCLGAGTFGKAAVLRSAQLKQHGGLGRQQPLSPPSRMLSIL